MSNTLFSPFFRYFCPINDALGDTIERNDFTDGALTDRLFRHAENHTAFFILGDGMRTGHFHRLQTTRAVTAHARENNA